MTTVDDKLDELYAQRVARRLRGITCGDCEHYVAVNIRGGKGVCPLMKKLLDHPCYPMNNEVQAKSITCLWFQALEKELV